MIIRVMKTNLMHYLSSVYFVNQHLHVSGVFVAHNQEVLQQLVRIGLCSCLYVVRVGMELGQHTGNYKVNTYELYIYRV